MCEESRFVLIGYSYGAYRKYVANELDWQIAGLWAGGIAAFAAGDYYASQ